MKAKARWVNPDQLRLFDVFESESDDVRENADAGLEFEGFDDGGLSVVRAGADCAGTAISQVW